MLVYDEDLEEMVEDNRKSYECPRCDMYWTNEDCEDDEFESWPKDEKLKGFTVLRIDDGKEIEYRKYLERLCPDCSEKTIDGRRKGPSVEIHLEGKELDYADLKCQVCGSKDMLFESDNRFAECATLICNFCNSYNFVEVDDIYNQKIVHLSYREDLQTKEFYETVEEILEILKTEGIEIKKGRRLK